MVNAGYQYMVVLNGIITHMQDPTLRAPSSRVRIRLSGIRLRLSVRALGFALFFGGGFYAFQKITSDPEPKEINKAEERLRANKLAAEQADKKIGGLKK
jgi:hypothetical protein